MGGTVSKYCSRFAFSAGEGARVPSITGTLFTETHSLGKDDPTSVLTGAAIMNNVEAKNKWKASRAMPAFSTENVQLSRESSTALHNRATPLRK